MKRWWPWWARKPPMSSCPRCDGRGVAPLPASTIGAGAPMVKCILCIEGQGQLPSEMAAVYRMFDTGKRAPNGAPVRDTDALRSAYECAPPGWDRRQLAGRIEAVQRDYQVWHLSEASRVFGEAAKKAAVFTRAVGVGMA